MSIASAHAPKLERGRSALDNVVLDGDDAGRVAAALEILRTVPTERRTLASCNVLETWARRH